MAPLVAIEPDLGATVFLLTGYALTLFLGGWPLAVFRDDVPAALIPAAASLLILRPYQMQRISGFMDAWKDLSQAPWQIRQSLMSIGSGGLEGTGIGSGWQKLSYLPEANTDFVFAVIGEELGLIGTLAVCFVWMAVFLTGRVGAAASASHIVRMDSGNNAAGAVALAGNGQHRSCDGTGSAERCASSVYQLRRHESAGEPGCGRIDRGDVTNTAANFVGLTCVRLQNPRLFVFYSFGCSGSGVSPRTEPPGIPERSSKHLAANCLADRRH